MIDRRFIGHCLPPVTCTLQRERLRFFAKAIGETDPVYIDVAAARAAGYPDLPAPPTFLFSAELDAGALEHLLDLLSVPIASILHGEQGFTYTRPICAGETVTVTARIDDLYAKKDGQLEFIVKTAEARDAAGETVATLRSVIVVRH